MGGSRREKKRPDGGPELEQVLAGESRLARRVRGLRAAVRLYAQAVELAPNVPLYREAFRRVGGPADWPPPQPPQPPKPGTAP